jgi:peptidoglycan hydrolase-like protein with peptidoglycan-binding domain
MKRRLHRISFPFLCLLLGYCYSCNGGDGNDAYMRPPDGTASNLNMKGEPLRARSPEEIAQMQDHLQQLGYDPGPTDGTYGPQTKLAIKRFQSEHGILSDGAAGALTEAAIRKAIYARETLQQNTPRSIESPQKSNP